MTGRLRGARSRSDCDSRRQLQAGQGPIDYHAPAALVDERVREEFEAVTASDVGLAAVSGTPANLPDTTTGEESQDPGSSEPA